MKPHAYLHTRALQEYPELAVEKPVAVQFKKMKRQKPIPHPDEESCLRLNAMAKESPFCIYYKEKSYDPL